MNQLQKPLRMTLSAQIVEQMEKCIADGTWPVGSKIPGETDLMKTFGVSRNTVREAANSLVHAGLLQALPGDGTYVLNRTRMDAALQERMKDAKLKETMQVRLVLETDIVRIACENGTEEDRDQLKKVREEYDSETADLEKFIRTDSAFHLQIAKMCHNGLLYDLYQSCISFIEEEIRVFQTESPHERQKTEHEELYQAVMNHEPVRAEKAVRTILDREMKVFAQAGLL